LRKPGQAGRAIPAYLEFMLTAEKTDLYKLHKSEYVTPKKPVFVDVPAARYLSIAGTGLPGGEEFQKKTGALYGTAFTLKFESKFAGRDYSVCKLEGIYWTDEGGPGFATVPMDQWHWELIVRTPEFVTASQLEAARKKMIAKGQPDAAEVQFQTIREGKCVQMLNVGPYAEEKATIERMCAFATSEGFEFTDRHHEIYLNDPRRVAPEKVKTILRMPLRRSGKA
jgi:hypothetical protein